MNQSISKSEADKIILYKIMSHDEGVFVDEVFFLDLLKHSLSLNVAEKQRVIDAAGTLEQHQFDELIKVFLEEREKFRELMKQHPEDIKKLAIKQQQEWIEIANLYRLAELEKVRKNKDQEKIDDIKSKLGL